MSTSMAGVRVFDPQWPPERSLWEAWLHRHRRGPNLDMHNAAESPARSEPSQAAFLRTKDAPQGSALARCYAPFILKMRLSERSLLQGVRKLHVLAKEFIYN